MQFAGGLLLRWLHSVVHLLRRGVRGEPVGRRCGEPRRPSFCRAVLSADNSVVQISQLLRRSVGALLQIFSADNVGGAQGAKSDRSSLACFALTLGLIIIYVRPRPRPQKRL